VLTDKRLSLYAAWFENRFSRFPEIRNYSLSEGGLEIKGLECKKPAELLDLPERREEIENIFSELYREIDEDFYSAEEQKKRGNSFEKSRNSLLEGLYYVERLALDAAEQAAAVAFKSRLGHLGKTEEERALEKLDAVNKAISSSRVKEIAGFLFPETEGWEEEIAAGTKDALTRHLEFSSRFYKALADAAAYNLLKLSA
jgi:hypothetical protein